MMLLKPGFMGCGVAEAGTGGNVGHRAATPNATRQRQATRWAEQGVEEDKCTWKFSAHGEHIKSSSLILDLTSLVVWYILLRTPFDVVRCSGGICYL
jgi:hypothetical protein